MFKKFLFVCFLSISVISPLFATYLHDDPKLGNIALEVGLWNTSLDGSISNVDSHTTLKGDLGFDDKTVINAFGLDLKNDIFWLPNVYINYFIINKSANSTLKTHKIIDEKDFRDSVSSDIEYSELNTILYGFLQQSIFEFDFGINIKKVDYTQITRENYNERDEVVLIGPTDPMILPYGALKIDLDAIDTVLKFETSILAFGDNEAKDYRYSINYRVMRNVYMSYGYRYNSWKSKNVDETKNEKYDMKIKGNYLNFKILF